MHYNKYFE